MERLAAGGVDFDDVTRVLEDDGIEKFAKSFEALLGVIADQAPGARRPGAAQAFGGVPQRRRRGSRFGSTPWTAAQLPKRIWARDPTVWKDDPDTPEIRDRLGWLTVGKAMAQQVKSLTAFADRGARGVQPRGALRDGRLEPGARGAVAHVRRRRRATRRSTCSTAPIRDAVRQAEQGGDLAKTLFIISSKSGTTQESDSFFRYFWERTGGRGSQFVAITDPGTPLERLAGERGFRRTFSIPPTSAAATRRFPTSAWSRRR